MKGHRRQVSIPEWREPHLFLFLALLIGVFAGLAVVCFRVAIEASRIWLLGSAVSPGWPRVLLVPTVIGLSVAVIVQRGFPAVRGSGVNQTKAAVYVYDGFIAFRTVIGKFLTSAISIGGGHSLGPEDPSLQIGAGLASLFGRRLGLSRPRVRLIAPVGAAAGLAAAFNAPITAVLFVIEEVIGTWSAVALGAIVVSAVSSAVVSQWFLGDQPLFRVPVYHLNDPRELLLYAALGVIGGAASLAFVKLVLPFRHRLQRLPSWTRYVQPGIAGAAIGLIGLRTPQVMGAGYEFIDAAMHDQYTWAFMAALAGLKILATSMSFGCGVPGGLFAPTLFIGAMVGGAVAGLGRAVAPGLDIATGAYTLIGMGTLFAGILRAPITSVFMIIEVSGNYSIVLPVMISNTIAYLVSRRFQRNAIFDVLAEQDGIVLPSMEQQRESAGPHVEDAMEPPSGLVDATITVEDALRTAVGGPREWLLFSLPPGRWFSARVTVLERLHHEGKGGETLGETLSMATPLPRLHPDQPLDAALRLIADHPVLPIVHRADSRHLVGVISLAHILAAYRRGAEESGREVRN
jgi:CIC family chloride channel protein